MKNVRIKAQALGGKERRSVSFDIESGAWFKTWLQSL
jgi:hypothetical protein